MQSQDPRTQPEPDANGGPSFPISQTELAEYQQLEARLRLDAAALAGWRHSLIERMAGPDSTEPGHLLAHVVYQDTGRNTLTEEGRRPILKRHLIVTEAR